MNDLLAATVRELANVGWGIFQSVNTRLPEHASIHPEWAPAPLLKTRQRSKPPLGWPRQTDSLCPRCVVEARNAIIRGERDLAELVNGHLGEIKATILEENGRILMRKTCPEHGTFEDTLSIDPEMHRIVESRYYGRDFPTKGDELIHRHGSSTIRHGRGAVLTIDLTNRCNMMCNPCFMDANQVGYVHELSLDEVKQILDDSISFKPRRQMSVQYSGGEPTMSPHFLEACRYAKDIGYYGVQAASNGLRFALEPEFAFQAKEAGLDLVYFQFDGVSNVANSHRHISNLFDAKMMAIENLAAAGIDITPVTTVVNTVNDSQVGPIFQFMIDNCERMSSVSFQPVSFTGRDEGISDEDRRRQRYTISHLAHELQRYSDGRIDPYRDWYPLGAIGGFTWLADHLRGTEVKFGGLSCSCHPNCGSSLFLMANTRTKAWAPVTQFFDMDQFVKDVSVICDTARGQPAQGAARPGSDRPAPGLQQEEQRSAPGRTEAGERVEAVLGGRDVVPGSLDLRLPPDRDVRDSLRHAGGGDLVLRLQHRGGLAADRGEHAHGRHDQGLVPGAGAAQDLRGQSCHGSPRPLTPGDERPGGDGRRGSLRVRLRLPLTGGPPADSAGGRHPLRQV
jgi:tetraether lipid synthase